MSKSCQYKQPPANHLHHSSLPSASSVLITLNHYALRLEDLAAALAQVLLPPFGAGVQTAVCGRGYTRAVPLKVKAK